MCICYEYIYIIYIYILFIYLFIYQSVSSLFVSQLPLKLVSTSTRHLVLNHHHDIKLMSWCLTSIHMTILIWANICRATNQKNYVNLNIVIIYSRRSSPWSLKSICVMAKSVGLAWTIPPLLTGQLTVQWLISQREVNDDFCFLLFCHWRSEFVDATSVGCFLSHSNPRTDYSRLLDISALSTQ